MAPLGFNLVNTLLFPKPESSYEDGSFPEDLIWIPRNLDPEIPSPPEDCIPCLLMPSNSARFFMLYLHSNAEDLGRCYHFCSLLKNQFQVHVLAVEYPGYGLCQCGEASEETVIEHANVAYRFITEVLHFAKEDIIVVGRSIGCGPALWLASRHRFHGVVLICPFLSVKEIIREHIGLLADFVEERFPNKDHIRKVSGSVLIIHGKQDKIVPCSHGQALYDACLCRKRMVSPFDMCHNSSLVQDPNWFVLPTLQFFGLPDYNFDQLRIPEWITDGRFRPNAGEERATPGPGPKAGGKASQRPHEPTSEPDIYIKASEALMDSAVQRFLKAKFEATQRPRSVSEDEFGEELVRHSLSKQDLQPFFSGNISQLEDLPSAPDDLGYFKVPRSSKPEPSLAGFISFRDAAEEPDICGFGGQSCATSWVPTLCGTRGRTHGAFTMQELITVSSRSESNYSSQEVNNTASIVQKFDKRSGTLQSGFPSGPKSTPGRANSSNRSSQRTNSKLASRFTRMIINSNQQTTS